MYDALFGTSDYPLTAFWMEYNAPITIDGSVSYEGVIPFSYRRVKKSSQREQQMVGLKATIYYTTIRSKDELLFKAKDRIKIGSKVYTIKSADKVENDLYINSRIIYQHFIDYETELILE
jgi:hypothetical protein